MGTVDLMTRNDLSMLSAYQPTAQRAKHIKQTPLVQNAYMNNLVNTALTPDPGSNATSGSDDLDMLFSFIISLSALRNIASDDDDGMPNLDTSGMLMSCLFSSLAGSQNSETGVGTSAPGDSNVAPVGGGNPAGIAQGVRGQSAASLMASQRVPMDRGIPTDVCCANFVSACLVKAGLLPASAHTNGVAQLKSTLLNRGWHSVSRSNAKPGDVCIVEPGKHTEIVAKNDNGRITLIGSNNTQGGSGPQVVKYDTWTGNQGNVTFLSR